mmetsp:Transcript_40733/g.65411  ORF Transcript_40733/g.65411 Transcript_40733/m.65411 type:complete len:502 (-) Transcript_40733:34-1539(-)
MGKAHKKDKMSYAQKKEAFWKAIISQKLRDVRDGLTNTGMEAQTRNEDGLTSIMMAAINNKPKSLDCLLDYYERRRELRRKGWIDIRDDNGRTALMMACAGGNVEMIESLLIKNAKVHLKDDGGMTARDHAVKRGKQDAIKVIDDWLRESEDEVEEDGQVYTDGLTSTQRNKLKKKQLQAQERRGMKDKAEVEEQVESDGEELGPTPTPVWPEIAKIVESIKMLRPIHEISVTRDADEGLAGGIDPALWHLSLINRLQLKLAPGVLQSLQGPSLRHLRKLNTLILNDNALTTLPEELGKLTNLKVLEVARNQLGDLPESFSNLKQLELLDLSYNKLKSTEKLEGISTLATINVCGNELTELDLDYSNLGRLHDLIASHNQITQLPDEIGELARLENLTLDNNKITGLPVGITQLKKITTLKLEENPIKDSKVVRMLKGDQRKDLWKYLIKISGGKGKKSGKKDKASKASAPPPKPPVEEDDEEDDAGFVSDDSFDITMEEL